ncbi:transcriptional regulator [Klebsiella sp. B345]|uniref:helix-turn-helix transcriptional regulator n=1 Tax=Klebsiella sp. B345 TaxID=2755398 RepID=UPI003DA83913
MTSEKETLINILSAALEALKTTLPLNTEAVLHDLTRPDASVISIINGHVSGRKTGDALLTGPEEDKGFLGLLETPKQASHKTFNGYTTTTAGGKVLNSASTLYYSSTGTPLVAFCINVDTNVVTRLMRDLEYLVPALPESAEPENTLAGVPEASLDEVLSRFRMTGSESQKEFRMRVVSEVHEMGFFKIKGSVNHLAKTLGVTRFTIYNYLEKLNAKS